MEARFPRETERLLLLEAFFFFFLSSSEELLEEDPVRAGADASAVAASVVVSAGVGVASTLFLGADPSLATVAASVAGLPVVVDVSDAAAGTSECNHGSGCYVTHVYQIIKKSRILPSFASSSL